MGLWYLEGVAGFDGGCQRVAVSEGEEEEIPLKVHATVFDAVHQVQLLQVLEASHQSFQLVVVLLRFIPFSVTARVGLFIALRRGWQPHRWEELIHLDAAHIVPAEGQQVQDHIGVRGARDEELQQVLQVSLKEHTLPAAAMLGHVAHRPTLDAASMPIVLIIDQIGSHRQWQVRGQVAQDLLLVLWEQLLQDRVVFGNGGRKTGFSHRAGSITTWLPRHTEGREDPLWSRELCSETRNKSLKQILFRVLLPAGHCTRQLVSS